MVRINLPDLGEGTKEATIKEWFVKEGQRIKEVSEVDPLRYAKRLHLFSLVRRHLRSIHRQARGEDPLYP